MTGPAGSGPGLRGGRLHAARSSFCPGTRFQGRSSSSRFCGVPAMRRSMSASQTCGSTPLSLTVPMSVLFPPRGAPRSQRHPLSVHSWSHALHGPFMSKDNSRSICRRICSDNCILSSEDQQWCACSISAETAYWEPDASALWPIFGAPANGSRVRWSYPGLVDTFGLSSPVPR